MLYQDKNNKVFDIPDLKESIEKAKSKGLVKLTSEQVKAYDNKPEFGVWNGDGWDIDEVVKLEQKIYEALKYLGDTDFYYPRYLETGEPVPTDVVIKRQEYRTFLRENENVR